MTEEERIEEKRQAEVMKERERMFVEMEREVKRVRDYIHTGKWTPRPADAASLS